jgi:hypothetical protein
LFQRLEADQNRAVVCDLGDTHLAVASLDGQFDRLENAEGHGVRGGLGLNRLEPLAAVSICLLPL